MVRLKQILKKTPKNTYSPTDYFFRFSIENFYNPSTRISSGDIMDGNSNQYTEGYEAQEQPPYQPPPGETQYDQPPYQQPYPPPDYGPQPPPGMPPPQPMSPPSGSSSPLPIVAGILLIIVALQAYIVGGALFVGSEFVSSFSDVPGADTLSDILKVCGIIFIILGILVILGAVSAITKKSWGLALVGSIIGIFTIGYYLTGTLLSIVALILLALSKDEFL
jgi:hypothetical protein